MNLQQSIDTAVTRFWANVQIGPADECWPWLAGRWSRKNNFQYGSFTYGGKTVKAHRAAYAFSNDVKLTSRSWVLHRCDNPPCCNPNHLFLGDRTANIKDMVGKGRARGAIGTKNAAAKITEQQVREIRASTEILRVLANRYKIKKSMISNIKRRVSWRHVA